MIAITTSNSTMVKPRLLRSRIMPPAPTRSRTTRSPGGERFPPTAASWPGHCSGGQSAIAACGDARCPRRERTLFVGEDDHLVAARGAPPRGGRRTSGTAPGGRSDRWGDAAKDCPWGRVGTERHGAVGQRTSLKRHDAFNGDQQFPAGLTPQPHRHRGQHECTPESVVAGAWFGMGLALGRWLWKRAENACFPGDYNF